MTILHTLRVALLWLIASALHVHAGQGIVHLADYHHTAWGTPQGAPGDITTIAQSSDGWLWLGTPAGLFRFDGMQFQKFTPVAGPDLQSGGVSSIWAADDGDLWIGYRLGGMSIVHEGRVRHIAGRSTGSLVGATYSMGMDPNGSMWVANANGLLHFSNGTWQRIDRTAGLPEAPVTAVFIDRGGRLWVSCAQRIMVLNRSTGMFVDSGLNGNVDSMAESADGRLWLGEKAIWRAMPVPAPAQPPAPGRSPQHTGRAAGLFDRDGNHWQLRCPVGICRTTGVASATMASFSVSTDPLDHVERPWQMGDWGAHTLLEDREGNVWIGTQAGLERLRPKKLRSATLPVGETHFQIAQNNENQIWAASIPSASLFRLDTGGLPVVDRTHRHLAIGTSAKGDLLLADTDKVDVGRTGASTFVPMPAGMDGLPVANNFPQVVCGDADSLWLGISFRGLFHYVNGHWADTRDYGIVPAGLRAAVSGRAGDAWLGNKLGGILHVERSGRFIRMPDSGVGPITMLDAAGRLIAAGERGLAFWMNGRFHLIRSADPDALTRISGMVVDAAGDRWFNGGKGLVHVRSGDWNAVLDQPDQLLRYELFDELDGYPGAAQTLKLGSTARRDGSGRLWFVGTGGIVSIDPHDMTRNPVPPAPVVTGLRTASATYGTATGQRLRAGTDAVLISYTALSLAMPERVRFDYMLDGVDTHWISAGNARAASYRNLGPGSYRFHVRATNEDGVASLAEANLAFSIQPTFIQTVWFKLLLISLLCGLLYSAYVWRMRRVGRHYEEQVRIRVAERERIARELHDTLLQSVQGLVLKVHGTSQRMAADDPLRGMLDDALTQAETTIEDGRKRVEDLRTQETRCRLLPLLEASGNAWSRDTGIAFALSTRGQRRQLTPSVGPDVLAICQEALGNAFQHGQGSQVTVTVEFWPKAFVVKVADNGIGIPADTVEQGGRSGHFGLLGMHERAARLGAKLSIAPRPEGGTACILTLPAAVAWPVKAARRWRILTWPLR